MAKKKQSQPLVTPSTAEKSSEVASTAKKPSENPTPVKKSSEAASTSKNKKQSEPVKTLPPESSSDEEEGSESEEEDDEPSMDSGNNPLPPSASAPASPDSESESEFDSPASTETTPLATAGGGKKRQSEEAASASTEENATKRAKIESETETSKKLFERVWTEKDEILILQGMIDFMNTTGISPYKDMNGFFESVKSSISFDVKGVYQFKNKISSLKKKYVPKMKNSVEPALLKSHDKTCLDLAKIIWGTDVVSTTVVKTRKKVKVEEEEDDSLDVQDDWFERSFLVGAVKDLSKVADEESVKHKWSLVPGMKRKRIEEMWKSLEANDLKCVLLKTELIHEVAISHGAKKYVSHETKRAKIESETETSKKLFERVWTEENEILILQGMIDFKNTTGMEFSVKDYHSLLIRINSTLN